MSVLNWKNINLFKLIPSMSLNANKLSFVNSEIRRVCSNTEFTIFCDDKSYVHILRSGCEKPITFRPSKNIILKSSISRLNNFLALLLYEETKNTLLLQVYDLCNINHHKIEPSAVVCRSEWNAIDSVRVLAIHTEGQSLIIAIGFERGELLLYKGLLRDTLVNFRSYKISTNPINAIEFGSIKTMFVCTDGEVICYTLLENRNLEKKIVLDAKNSNTDSYCALQTSTNLTDPYFLVARKNAVYCFTTDGRGPCYAIEGLKTGLLWYKQYLVMIVLSEHNNNKNTSVLVIDILNKLIVLKKKISNIGGIFTNGKDCFLFTKSNELFVLQEYNIENKIELLLKNNLFDIALRFVNLHDCDTEISANIYFQHGNSLMLKGNFELAVEKYIQTIGIMDPYIIIQKLLDSKHNIYLFQYLKVLIERGYGEEKHVKLMLNCNERLHLSSSLDSYLGAGTLTGLPQYCVANPINISKKGVIVDISYSAFLSVIKNEVLALEFFSNMEEQKIYDFFLEYGQNLLSLFPNSVLSILKKLCLTSPIIAHSPERFVPILLEQKKLCESFLNSFVEANYKCNSSVYNILFEIYLSEWCAKNTNSNTLISFLNKHIEFFCKIHIMSLCKSYSFWPGLVFVYQVLYPRNNSIDLNNSVSSDSFNCEELIKSKFLKNAQAEKTDVFIYRGLVSYFTDEYTSSGKYFLELINIAIKNKSLQVSYYNDMLCQKSSKSLLYVHSDAISKCVNELKISNNILFKYSSSPIEFRSNVCNICRQEIYLPAYFFLCQHAFHKDCINTYSEQVMCATCGSQHLRNSNPIIDTQYLTFINGDPKTYVVDVVSAVLEKGLESNKLLKNYFKLYFQSLILPLSDVFSSLQKHISISTNPFEGTYTDNSSFEKYDNNLNPFESQI